MDFRAYGLPIHTGYSEYLEKRSARADPDPGEPYQHDSDPSLGTHHLSDDQRPDPKTMGHWTSTPKKHTPKGSDTDNTKHRDPPHKPPSASATAATRNQNPGIDITLRNLHHEAGTALRLFHPLVQTFDHQTLPLQGWADAHTLDTVWRDKVRDHLRACSQRERARFEGAAARLAGGRAAVKNAAKLARALKGTWDDRYGIERQVWTARKALVYAEWVVELAERAPSERLACRQLVVELEEIRGLLGPERHPWICELIPVGARFAWNPRYQRAEGSLLNDGIDGEEEAEEGDILLKKKTKASSRLIRDGQSKRGDSRGGEEMLDEVMDDGSRIERQGELECSLPESSHQPEQNEGDTRGREDW